MIRPLLVVAALALGATAVVAQGDPIAQRKAAMKSVGAAAKVIGDTMKGDVKFDNAEIQKSLATFATVSKDYDKFFPATAKEGGETTAAPKIWEDMAGFKAGLAKLNADATAAQASIKDEASFKAEIGKVMGDCKACHDVYRVKK